MHRISILILMILLRINSSAQDRQICDCYGFDLPREINISTKVQEEEPCFFSETAPEFPGGSDKLLKFIRKNSSYEVLENSISSSQYESVYICLMIDKAGAIIEKKIRSSNNNLKSDILKVISLMPAWIPAKQSKMPVIGRYTFEIRYKK